MERLKNSDRSMAEYKSNLMEKHREAVNQLNMMMTSTLQSYRSQHQSFLAHCNNQIQVIHCILKKNSIKNIQSLVYLNHNVLQEH